MEKEITKTEEEAHQNPLLAMPVIPDSELKDYLVEYVGTKMEQEEVTVNMIAEILAVEFPEFIYAIAEENYLRGYQVGLDDADRLFNEYAEKLNRKVE
jgi:hypothetical protein|tara:strand:+ start:451 stop:744 length:294 start_codon:yes stop_codon:yes gene_type:complete